MIETTNPKIQRWHDYMLSGNMDDLDKQLHEDAEFVSPVVHTPQKGKALSKAYLGGAFHILGGPDFRYTRIFDCGNKAVLEFAGEIDGIAINGVDMIEWDENEKITHFKVMVRPLKAIQKVHAAMGAMLEKM